jgi:hypothetical protein
MESLNVLMKGIIMHKVRWSFSLICTFVLVVVVSMSCEKKKDDAAEESGFTGVAAVALNNIDGVQSNYSPDSMETTSTAVISPFSKGLFSEVDFCEGKNFYACQPKLVKLYVAITKSYLSLMKLFLAGFSQGLSNIQDGDAKSGVVIDEYSTIDYSKTNATQYSILVKAGADSYFYFSSGGTTYNLQIDFSKVPVAKRSASDPSQGKVSVTLAYTDNDHWTLNLYAYDFACNEADPKAPEQVKIVMHKNDTIWNGKAMLQNSRSMKGNTDTEPVTCTTTASDDYSLSSYTEFIGDKTATKAGGYLMKRTVTASTSSEYSSAGYALNNLCGNYWSNYAFTSADQCNTILGGLFGESLSTYVNPFCMVKGTGLASWNDNCSATSTTVSAASFDDSEVTWNSPATLLTTTITLPTTAQ